MDTVNQPHLTEITTDNSSHRWKIISGILTILLITSALSFSFLVKKDRIVPAPSITAIISPMENPTKANPAIPLSDLNMTPLSKVGLQMKIPSALDYYLPLVEAEIIQPNVQGSTYCVTFVRTSRKDRVPPCGDNDVIAGTTSVDWDGGTELSLLLMQGFVKENDTYFVKFNTSKFEVLPGAAAKEIVSNGGVKILLIEPENITNPEGYGIGYMWPKKGYLAAVVNTPSATYPGLVFLAKIEAGISRQTFEEMLLSLKNL